MRFRTRPLAAALLMCASPWVLAAGWVAVLKNTPAEAFQDDDLQLFLSTARQVLETDVAAPPATWSNAATGAGGNFRVLGRSVNHDGWPCKRVRIGVYAKERSEKTAVWAACKNPARQGRLVGAG